MLVPSESIGVLLSSATRAPRRQPCRRVFFPGARAVPDPFHLRGRLYNEAKQRNTKGRSGMTKKELRNALGS
jgi:hypothetical protein